MAERPKGDRKSQAFTEPCRVLPSMRRNTLERYVCWRRTAVEREHESQEALGVVPVSQSCSLASKAHQPGIRTPVSGTWSRVEGWRGTGVAVWGERGPQRRRPFTSDTTSGTSVWALVDAAAVRLASGNIERTSGTGAMCLVTAKMPAGGIGEWPVYRGAHEIWHWRQIGAVGIFVRAKVYCHKMVKWVGLKADPFRTPLESEAAEARWAEASHSPEFTGCKEDVWPR